MRRAVGLVGVLTLVAVLVAGAQVRTPQSGDRPETVMVTFRPRAGAESDLARAIARHYDTARELNLVLAEPHVTVRGQDAQGRAYFVDVFSWRDASIPDDAPPAIQAIWADMTRLVEAREGAIGLEVAEVAIVKNPQQ